MCQWDKKTICLSGYNSHNFKSPVFHRYNGTQVTKEKMSFVFQFTCKIFCVLNLETDYTHDGRYGVKCTYKVWMSSRT